MALLNRSDAAAKLAEYRQELARRIDLVREDDPEDTRSPHWKLLLGEAGQVAEPVRRIARRRRDPAPILPKTATPRTVIMIPGFATHPLRMRYFARSLEKAGHTVKNWGQGFNWGVSHERFMIAERRLLDVHRRCGEPVCLVGWSLGGLFARELAKRHPHAVAKVVTMGSPFSGSPRANNAWRMYQLIAGHRVDAPPVGGNVSEKPPVPTIALWSPRDGVVDPRSAAGKPGERDKAVALRCTHIGFSFSPEAIRAVGRELEAG
ncbi:esterase/lipase family protein [Qipengyuania sp. DSG2-2]|uniref:esterase/lipase family protein n=1 Tax=Qipengyuania sp. DGS2-2 TaxID=3349631 RepID=UPI0036D2DD1D